jgi:hypothetical protein
MTKAGIVLSGTYLHSRRVLPDDLDGIFAGFEGTVRLWDVCPGGEEGMGDAWFLRCWRLGRSGN